MRKLFNTGLGGAAAVLLLASFASAQRTATVGEKQQTPQPASTPGMASAPKPPPAPQSVKAKYEGGIVGYGKTDGTLSFDDANRRMLFRDKQGRELLSISFDIVTAAWADTKSQRSTTGTVLASTVPYGLGLPGLFMRSTTRYLVLQYRDPDTRAEGVASFKLPSKELLASVLYTFAEKAGLTQRGEAFVRRAEPTVTTRISDRP
jgi:hypothetical protein